MLSCLLSRREQIQRLSNQLHTDFGPDRLYLTWIVLRQAERHVSHVNIVLH